MPVINKTEQSSLYIIRPVGDQWEYAKQGDQVLTRKKGSEDWITATGAPKAAIEEKILARTDKIDRDPSPQVTPQVTPQDGQAGGQVNTVGPDMTNGAKSVQRFLRTQGHDIQSDGAIGKNTKAALAEYNKTLPDVDKRLPLVKNTQANLKCDKYTNCAGKAAAARRSITGEGMYATPDGGSISSEDSWFNKSYIKQLGGDVLFEVDPKKSGMDNPVPKELWGSLQVGDYVSMYRGPTSFAKEEREGLENEGNSHMGTIVGRNERGAPMVYHAAGNKSVIQPLDNNAFSLGGSSYQISSIYRDNDVGDKFLENPKDSPLYYTEEEFKNKKETLISKKHGVEIKDVKDVNLSINENNNLNKKQQKSAEVLEQNKVDLMYQFDVSPDDYNTISSILMGISHKESGGRKAKVIGKRIVAGLTEGDKLDWLPKGKDNPKTGVGEYYKSAANKKDEASVGMYQVKPWTNFRRPEDGELTQIGRTLKDEFGVPIPKTVKGIAQASVYNNTISGFAIDARNLDNVR